MSWDAETYRLECAARKIWSGLQTTELGIEHDFPPVTPGIHSITKPSTIVDSAGRILCWILPDLLPSKLEVIDDLCFTFQTHTFV